MVSVTASAAMPQQDDTKKRAPRSKPATRRTAVRKVEVESDASDAPVVRLEIYAAKAPAKPRRRRVRKEKAAPASEARPAQPAAARPAEADELEARTAGVVAREAEVDARERRIAAAEA